MMCIDIKDLINSRQLIALRFKNVSKSGIAFCGVLCLCKSVEMAFLDPQGLWTFHSWLWLHQLVSCLLIHEGILR